MTYDATFAKTTIDDRPIIAVVLMSSWSQNFRFENGAGQL